MHVATFCSHLYSVTIEVSAYGKQLQFACHPHLQKQNPIPRLNGSLSENPPFLQQPWLHVPMIAHFLLLCVLSPMRDACQDLCPCSADGANCFRLVGSDICHPWVAQKRQRDISSQSEVFCPRRVSSVGSFSFRATHCIAGGGQYSICLCHCCHCQIERRRD